MKATGKARRAGLSPASIAKSAIGGMRTTLITGPMGSARWITTVKALIAASIQTRLQFSIPPKRTPTSHPARPESTDAAPSDVTPPIIRRVSQAITFSARFHDKRSTPGRNIAMVPPSATTTVLS